MADGYPVTMSKGIPIGVVGDQIVVSKIEEELKGFPSFVPVSCVYESEDEAPALAEALLKQVDILLFSGYLPYRKTKEKISFSIPVHYVTLKGSGLYRSLYRLKSRYGLENLSVDSLTRSMVDSILEDLNEASFDVYHFKGHALTPTEEIVAFHLDHYNAGRCRAVLTGNRNVAEALTKLDVPNEWVIPTNQDIIIALERALLATETRQNKEAQIVVGLINIDDFSRVVDRCNSEFELQKLKLDIQRMLLDYVKLLDGHLTNLGGDEYLFFTTRGVFERETGGYKSIPLLQEAKYTMKISLSIGIGFGQSANQAGTHARLALRQSKEFGGDICFIVREDRSVIGPIEMGDPMIFDIQITDQELLERAEKAGMTAAYMSRLMAQVARYGKTDYTAQELAPILGVTVRSTHRILLQWLDAELVEVVGEEKITGRGRPRQVYRLTFIPNQATRQEVG